MQPNAVPVVKTEVRMLSPITASLVLCVQQTPYVEKIPGTLVSFKMIPVAEGELNSGGTKVSIKPYYIGETELLWDVFDIYAFRLDLTPEQNAAGFDAQARPTKPYGAPDRGYGHAGYPALSMTYHSAKMFCEWLSKKTGKKYRLPTTAEWEYAARAGASELPSDLKTVAWFRENAEFKTQPGAKLKPNGWGLYDMLGNAGEWATDAEGKPVLCGGTFRDKKEGIRYDAKATQQPSWNSTDPQNPKSPWWLSDGGFVGLRVVCDP